MRFPPFTPHFRLERKNRGWKSKKTPLLSLLSCAIFRPDNSVPPRISLGLIMAQRLPVSSGDSVEVPYDFAATNGQFRFEFLCSLHAGSVNVCKSETALRQAH